jgi:DNA-binding transcriptional LysR family regulator
LYAWEFEKGNRELKTRVDGQLVFNGTTQMLNAALAGFGLAYVPEDLALTHLAKGRLKRVLEDWCPTFPGYHLYYPSRRQSSPAFALLVDALRYRSQRGGAN